MGRGYNEFIMKNINDVIKLVTATELRRNFGDITKDLVKFESLVVTKGGEPFAILKAVPAKKREVLMEAAGSWKGTNLDDDELWTKVLKKKSRETPIDL